jgi:tetratricopeptide (TPR) repeat protein
VLSTTVRDGFDAAVRRYRELRETDSDSCDFSERQLNRAGYQLLRAGRTTDAIRVFELNVEMFPDAFNTYDSLGEAYMVAGETERGIDNYEKSLELNPENENAVEMLRQLRKAQE